MPTVLNPFGAYSTVGQAMSVAMSQALLYGAGLLSEGGSIVGPYVGEYGGTFAFQWDEVLGFDDNTTSLMVVEEPAGQVFSLRELLEQPGVALSLVVPIVDASLLATVEEAFDTFVVPGKMACVAAMTGATADLLDSVLVVDASGLVATKLAVVRYRTAQAVYYQMDSARWATSYAPPYVSTELMPQSPIVSPSQPYVGGLFGLIDALNRIADMDIQTNVNRRASNFSITSSTGSV